MPPSPEMLGRLASIRTIDITTYGRRSGLPRRVEIWWFHIDGRFIITGTPGKRDWMANLRANPALIVHAAGLDLPARAVEIEDPGFRRVVFTDPATRWYNSMSELEALVRTSPMIEVVWE